MNIKVEKYVLTEKCHHYDYDISASVVVTLFWTFFFFFFISLLVFRSCYCNH